jgi:hypothetical protein
MTTRLAISLALLVALALATGCAPGVQRMADPSAGNFYTEEEYQKPRTRGRPTARRS